MRVDRFRCAERVGHYSLRLGIGARNPHVERHGRTGQPVAQMDDALDRHRPVSAGIVGRALQQRLQRRLELVDGVDVQQRVHRVARPLDRRSALDDEFLVDEVLQREQVASFGDGVVAVHLEFVRSGVDVEVERALAAALDRAARCRVDDQLEVEVRPDVECHGDLHASARSAFALAPPFEHQLLARQIARRVGIRRLDEGDEVGVRDIRLARERQNERGVVVGRGRDVELHAPLVARDGRQARGEDAAVEEFVVLLGRIEHQHLLRSDPHVVGDVREVLQAEVEVESAPVAQRVENRDVFRPEPVVAHLQHGARHRVGHPREVYGGRKSCHVDTAREFGVAVFALQGQPHVGAPFRVGDDAREHRVDQPHVEAVDADRGVVAHLLRGVEAADERRFGRAVGQGDARPVAAEVPARFESQGRHRDPVDPHAVHQDVGRDLAGPEGRLDRGRTVRIALDVVAYAVGDLREGGQVEVAQMQREGVFAVARGDAVDREALLAVHHMEVADGDLRRIDPDAAGEDLPGHVAAGDVRREDVQIDRAACRACVGYGGGPDAEQPRAFAQRVRESRRQLQLSLPGASRDREARQVEHARIKVLGRGVDGQRIAVVDGVDAQPRDEHPLAFDILRRHLHRQLVAHGVEHQLQRRTVGDL